MKILDLKNLYVIDCLCDGSECHYFHKSTIYSREEAEQELANIDSNSARVETLKDQLKDISYWYY